MLQISIVIISIVDVIGSQIGISAPFPGLATVRTRMLGDHALLAGVMESCSCSYVRSFSVAAHDLSL